MFWDKASLLDSEAINSVRLDGQWARESSCPRLPRTRTRGVCFYANLFTWVLEIWSQIHMISRWAFTNEATTSAPSWECMYIKKCILDEYFHVKTRFLLPGKMTTHIASAWLWNECAWWFIHPDRPHSNELVLTPLLNEQDSGKMDICWH